MQPFIIKYGCYYTTKLRLITVWQIKYNAALLHNALLPGFKTFIQTDDVQTGEIFLPWTDYKSILFVTYTVCSEMCFLHLNHPWGSLGIHSTAPGDQLKILSQYLGQGYWLEIGLYMFSMAGEIHTHMGRTCRLHIERPCLSWESYQGQSCYEATVLTTYPPCPCVKGAIRAELERQTSLLCPLVSSRCLLFFF